jgi:hypothetical protein
MRPAAVRYEPCVHQEWLHGSGSAVFHARGAAGANHGKQPAATNQSKRYEAATSQRESSGKYATGSSLIGSGAATTRTFSANSEVLPNASVAVAVT